MHILPGGPSRSPVARGLCAGLIALVALTSCSGDDDGVPVLEAEVSAEGTCLQVDDDLPAEVTRLPVVPCAEPHTHELYAVVPFDEGDVFPGIEALDAFAQRECLRAFNDFVGIQAFDSSLFFSWMVPTLGSWNNDDDRDVLCVLGDFQGGQMVGSMRGAKI